MGSKAFVVLLTAGLALATTGCDKVQHMLGREPSGQVVATVNGQEITSLELRNELSGFSSRDPKLMKQAQDQALQQIIIRDLLAQRAKAQKLDRLPQFAIQVRRGESTLLAQMYESKLFSAVAPPTPQEAANYVDNNPEKFANRRIFVVDQIVAPAGRVKKERVPGIKSLEEVKAMLDNDSVPYQENVAVVDTLNAEPETVHGIDKLPPGEVFVFATGNVYEFNRVASKRDAPFRGELAKEYAEQQLRRAQALDFVRTQILGMRRAAEATIQYAKGYKPDNPDAGIAPVSGAPGSPPEKAPGGGAVPAAPAPK